MPGVHVLLVCNKKVVDGRDKPGHDGEYVKAISMIVRTNPQHTTGSVAFAAASSVVARALGLSLVLALSLRGLLLTGP